MAGFCDHRLDDLVQNIQAALAAPVSYTHLECDIKFPYQVPEKRYFVLGDHRATSIDSRSSVCGCVEKIQIVGKVFLRVWPLFNFSLIH